MREKDFNRIVESIRYIIEDHNDEGYVRLNELEAHVSEKIWRIECYQDKLNVLEEFKYIKKELEEISKGI